MMEEEITRQVVNFTACAQRRLEEEKKCLVEMDSIAILPEKVFCPTTWDGVLCWPQMLANSTSKLPCPDFVQGFNIKEFAYKNCTSSGMWLSVDDSALHSTDYTKCMNLTHVLHDHDHGNFSASLLELNMQTIRGISRIGYILSLSTLIVSFLILGSIRVLHCRRNKLHLHLFTSFMMRAVMYLAEDSGVVSGLVHAGINTSNENIRLLENNGKQNIPSPSCQVYVTFWLYSIMANYSWIFIEGLYLHNLIFLALIVPSPSICKYTALGWGFPVPFILFWIIFKSSLDDAMCWTESSNPAYFWIIRGPITASIIANFLLFLNIMRTIYMKTFAPQSPRHYRYRKWFRSTLILLPLFGVHYTITTIVSTAEENDKTAELTWLLLDQEFSSFQGFVVALLYCFANSEVRGALWNVWLKWKKYLHYLSPLKGKVCTAIRRRRLDSQDALNPTCAKPEQKIQSCQYCSQEKSYIDLCKSQDTVLSFLDLENTVIEESLKHLTVIDYANRSPHETSAIIEHNHQHTNSLLDHKTTLQEVITNTPQNSNMVFLPAIIVCSPNHNNVVDSDEITKSNNYMTNSCELQELINHVESLATHLTNEPNIYTQEQKACNLNVLPNFGCHCNERVAQNPHDKKCDTCNFNTTKCQSSNENLSAGNCGKQCCCGEDIQYKELSQHICPLLALEQLHISDTEEIYKHKTDKQGLPINFTANTDNLNETNKRTIDQGLDSTTCLHTIHRSQLQFESICTDQCFKLLECSKEDRGLSDFKCKSDHDGHFLLENLNHTNHAKNSTSCEIHEQYTNVFDHRRECGKSESTSENSSQKGKFPVLNTESYRPRSRSDGSKWFNTIKKPERHIKSNEWIELQENQESRLTNLNKLQNVTACPHHSMELGSTPVRKAGNVLIINANMNKCTNLIQNEIGHGRFLAVPDESISVWHHRPRSKSECTRKPGGYRNTSNQKSPPIPAEWMKPTGSKDSQSQETSPSKEMQMEAAKEQYGLVDIPHDAHIASNKNHTAVSLQHELILDIVIEEKAAEIRELNKPIKSISNLIKNQILEEGSSSSHIKNITEKSTNISYETPLLTDMK